MRVKRSKSVGAGGKSLDEAESGTTGELATEKSERAVSLASQKRKPGKLGVHEKGKGGSRGGGRDVGDSKSGGENEENGGSDNNPQDKQTQAAGQPGSSGKGKRGRRGSNKGAEAKAPKIATEKRDGVGKEKLETTPPKAEGDANVRKAPKLGRGGKSAAKVLADGDAGAPDGSKEPATKRVRKHKKEVAGAEKEAGPSTELQETSEDGVASRLRQRKLAEAASKKEAAEPHAKTGGKGKK